MPFKFICFSFPVQLLASDDDALAIEEEEVIHAQRENAKSMSMEDFGIEDTSEEESERELTLEVRIENCINVLK